MTFTIRTVRADRLIALMLLLQARGRTTAAELAAELEVSVRTIYRDVQALSAAGVPVFAESGPGGGCELLGGYRSPLAGLSSDEAAALLMLDAPEVLRELDVADAAVRAHEWVRTAAGVPATGRRRMVHLDPPRWFHERERLPALVTISRALRETKMLSITYRRGVDDHAGRRREVSPLGLVNKSGIWYLVALSPADKVTVFRVSRIVTADEFAVRSRTPDDFDLAAYWERWSSEFETSRPRIKVLVRVSPEAFAALPEIFGAGIHTALATAGAPDDNGWRTVTFTFEDSGAAAYRLAGFGDLIEVVEPQPVIDHLLETATRTLRRYAADASAASSNARR